MATTKAFELAQLSANVTSTAGATEFTGLLGSNLGGASAKPLHVKGSEDTVGIFESSDFNSRVEIRDNFADGGDGVTTASVFIENRGGILNLKADTADVRANSRIEFTVDTTKWLQLNHLGQLSVIATTGSTSSTTGALAVAGGAGIAENLYVGGNTVISGDLTVEGTSVTLNTTDLNVEDKNITLNYHASNDTSASAGGAGITIQDAVDASNDASILWDSSSNRFDFSHKVAIDHTGNATALKIGDPDTIGSETEIYLRSTSLGKLTIPTTGTIRFKNTTPYTIMDVKGDGDVEWYEDNNSAGGGTPAVGMHWDYADGRLGIGTDAPVDLLTIQSPASGGGNGITLKRNDNGTDQRVGAISFGNTEDDDLAVIAVKTSTGNNSDGNLEFYTQLDADTTPTKRMTIASDGNVGIGTEGGMIADTPLTIVNYATTTTIVPQIKLAVNCSANDSTAGASIDFVGSGDITAVGSRIIATRAAAGAHMDLRFHTQRDQFAMIIDETQNVGIGTTAPASKLHISGNSDTSDEDCMLIIEDVDGSAGSRIPAIVFRSNTGGTVTNQARIRGTDTQGIVMSGSATLGDDLVVQAGGVGIGTTSPAHKLDVDGAIGARQVRHSIRPTLNLDFANSKELDSRITFYRNSIATYYGSDGILKYASHNTPRFDHNPTTGECRGLLIEEDRSNIFIYSNPIADLDFASGWVNNAANKIQITINAGEAPDGTYSATRISSLINSQTDPDVYMYQSHNLNGGETITYSIWIKAPNAANVGKHVEFRGKRIGGSGSGWGAVGILTADWQRISVSNTYNADNNQTARAYFGARTNYGYFTDPSGASVQFDAASEVLVWGAVAEEGGFVTSYIPTNLTSVSRSTSATYQDKDGVLRTAYKNEPRFGYKWDGGKYVPTGLTVEPAVTNLSAETESFGGAWYSTSYTKGSEYTTLPNGQKRNAVKFIMNSGQSPSSATSLGVYLGVLPRVQNQIYNSSFFAKIPASGAENGVRIRDGLRTGAFLDINLNNGEVTNQSTSTFMDVIVEKYAHGWWRISYNYLYTGATGSGSWHAIRSYNTGNGTVGWLIWGAQVTTAAFSGYFGVSSYVPNPTGTYSAVTKTADVPDGAVATRDSDYAYIDIEKYNFWNDRESTIYAETETYIEDYTLGNYNASQYAFAPDSGRVQIRYDNTDGIHAIGYSSPAGVFTNIFTLTPPTATFVTSSKTALSIKQDDYDFSVNGSTISGTASDATGAFPAPTKLFFGAYREIASAAGNSEHLNGAIKKISYYDKKLTNAEMQALTENN